MKRTARIVMVVFFFISMAGGAYAWDFGFFWDYGNPPIWKIFKNGKAAYWVDWINNRRFAIYNPGTPNDPSDDLVLDKETGLVWERSPSISPLPWYDAQPHCNGLTLGNRRGWRLPTLQELASLVDLTQSNPSLPAGHPFSNVQLLGYCSATSSPAVIVPAHEYAWIVDFGNGGVAIIDKSSGGNVWCVRGGQGVDPQ